MFRFQFTPRNSIAGIGKHPAAAQPMLSAVDLVDQAEPPFGPGWFDSSWDLNRGLEVREGLPGDARLNEWLAVCLRSEPDAQCSR